MEKIIWGSIPIIGLEDGDLTKYSVKTLTAIENGKNAWVNKTEDDKKDIAQRSAKSRTGRKASKEHGDNISKALSGKSKSDEHKLNLAKSKIGKKQSAEIVAKKKEVFKGEGNPMYGKNHKEESIKKITENHAAKKLIKCPHCGKECPGNNYKRYHGDNCKLK
jgi:hypothetical protein